jgi:hypothetical protein
MQMRRFGRFHPQYKGITLYGIIAAVDTVSESQRAAVFDAGLYLVTMENDVPLCSTRQTASRLSRRRSQSKKKPHKTFILRGFFF